MLETRNWRAVAVALLVASAATSLEARKATLEQSASAFTSAERASLRAIEAEYARMSAGFAAGDVTPVLRARTADFVTVAPDGQLRDASYSAEVARRFFTTNKPPYSVRSQIRCARFPDPSHALLVIFQQVTRYQDLAGSLRRVDSDITQREHWRLTPAGWRLEMVDAIHDPHRWVDGKPIDPSMPYNPAVAPFSPKLKAARTCADLLRTQR